MSWRQRRSARDVVSCREAKAEPPPKPEENTPVSPVEEDVEKDTNRVTVTQPAES